MDSGSFDYITEGFDDGLNNDLDPSELPYNGTLLGVSPESQFMFRILILGIVSFSITCACIKTCSNSNQTRNYTSSNRQIISNHSNRQNEDNLTQFLIDHRHITSPKSNDSSEDCGTCAICIEPFNPSEDNLVLDCNHEFHVQCIVSWFEKDLTCPICRKELNL